MTYRLLESSDLNKGFLELLSQLTTVGDISKNMFLNKLKSISKNSLHKIFVLEKDNKIISCPTLFIEDKFIHSCGRVAHVEDVVVHSGYRGMQLGKKIIDFLSKEAERMGILSLYKGYKPAVIGGTLYVGMQMFMYDFYKNEIFQNNGISPLYLSFLCGSLTGCSNNLLFYPTDIVKRRLQVNGINNKTKIHKNVYCCIKYMIKHEGIIGFYRVMPITLVKVIPATSLQFGLYEYFKKKMR